jgi:hypothetical protein
MGRTYSTESCVVSAALEGISMHGARERLPNRRAAETFDLDALGLKFRATVGRFDDGRLAEIFITNHKAGSMAGILASDSALLCSLALQHGVPVDVIRKALKRDPQGNASSPLGRVLDQIARRRGEMSDVAAAEVSAEPMPSVPPAPEAAAEVEAALVSTVDTSLSPLEAVEAPGATAPEQPDAADPPEDSERRSLPGVDHLGVLRRSVLDALLDNERPLTVAEIIAHLPVGTTRGGAESAVKREFDAGRIERVALGVYRLAPAKPPEAKPAAPPEPVRSDGISDEQWLAWLHEWRATSRWEGPGNPPGQSGCAVPLSVIAKHNDAVRKRAARQRDREAAQARQSAADQELRTVLLRACNGNFSASLQVDDLAPVREVLKVFPLDRLLVVIRQKVDKRCFPGNPPLVSWHDLLQAFAEEFCRVFAIPGLVKEWGAAGRAPTSKMQSSPAAGDPTDLDRSHHDNPHAPPGPHNLPGAAPSAPDTAQKPADASEPLPAVSATPDVSRRARSLSRNGLLGRKIRPTSVSLAGRARR